jgi:hypothetical protein
MLGQTLRSLERDGLVTRRVCRTRPVTVEYSLTLGRTTIGLLAAIRAWAEEHAEEGLEARRNGRSGLQALWLPKTYTARVAQSHHRRLLRAAAAGFAVFGVLTQGCGGPATHTTRSPRRVEAIRIEHAQVLAQLKDKQTGRCCEMSVEEKLLIRSGWALVGEFATAYLNEHPRTSADELAKQLVSLNPPNDPAEGEPRLYCQVLVLAPKVLLVVANYQGPSTFFVVNELRPGTFRVAWRVLDDAIHHFARRDEIGRWAYLSHGSYGDGPLSGSAHLLPADRSGRPRFYLNAWSVGDGGTRLWQLSVWSWDGLKAVPLLIDAYWTSWAAWHELGESPDSFDGSVLAVRTKEDLQHLFSCGMCAAPTGWWKIRIEPDRIVNLGHALDEPAYQVLDELLTRVPRGEDASHLAAPAVITELQRMIDPKEHKLSFGMLGGGHTFRDGAQELFDVTFDDAHFRFTIERPNGRFYFRAMKVLSWYR